MYSSNYNRLFQSCKPQTVAITDNTKFINIRELQNKQQNKICDTKSLTSDPKIWGPILWSYLHYSAINYPEHPTKQQVKEMKDWLCSLPTTIPCKNCSQHYRKYIEQNREQLDKICSCRDHLFNFLVDIHNKVNKRNGKKELTYDEARKIYS